MMDVDAEDVIFDLPVSSLEAYSVGFNGASSQAPTWATVTVFLALD